MKVLLTWFPPEDHLSRVRNGLPKGTTVVFPKPRPVLSPFEVAYDDDVDLVKDVDIVVGCTVPDGIWEKLENLKAVVWTTPRETSQRSYGTPLASSSARSPPDRA